MNRWSVIRAALLIAIVSGEIAQTSHGSDVPDPSAAATVKPFPPGRPNGDGPVTIQCGFHFHDINSINDEAETFDFTGVLTLRWQDDREKFDPVEAGVAEKVFQGVYQVNEVFSGWSPQIVLVNRSGSNDLGGVVLRVKPDGSVSLIQTINSTAKTSLNVMAYPFDRHQLDMFFEVLGYDAGEVRLVAESESASAGEECRIPEWAITGYRISTNDRMASSGRSGAISSTMVVTVGVRRLSFFVLRLVVFPLVAIVLLSFSVFWMDRSSLADRIGVSFIGILTAVTFQIVMSDILPRVAHPTFIHALISISFLTMCSTVVISLVVGSYDKRGMSDWGDRVDARCRWLFPTMYLAFNVLSVAAALFVA